MDNQKLKSLSSKILSGEATDEEKRLFNEWYESFNSENIIIPVATANEKQVIKENLIKSILSKIEKPSVSFRKQYNFWPSGNLIKVAASILIFIFIGFSANYIYQSANKSAKVSYQIYGNPSGKKSIHKLPDGSIVYLNAESKLKFNQDLKNRVAYLEGEAYFEVAPNKKIPFLVHCNNLDIKVLGTAFNVNSYKSGVNSIVSVSHGHVMVGVNNTDKSHIKYSYSLKASQQVSFNPSTHFVKLDSVSQKNIASWRENKLLFEDEPFKEVIGALQRHYGVNIIIENSNILYCPVSAKMNSISLNVAMDQLSKILGFTYIVKENKYYLRGGSCMKK